MQKSKHPVMLLVLDGWGYSEETAHNAIHHASTPVWDRIWEQHPRTLIDCSGLAVGLPDQQMGNSEVGHMHIGAGRLIDQDLTRISKDIEGREFFKNARLITACETAAANGGSLHVMGLLSPGGVHSHEDHIIALINLANAHGVKQIYCHAFLDGRDTPPASAEPSLERLSRHCEHLGTARLASICGRYYAMDRNQNWERTALAHKLIVDGEAEHSAADALSGLRAAYQRGETDEFVLPTVIESSAGARHRVKNGDVIVFANFRSDRARQLSATFTSPEDHKQLLGRTPTLGQFVTMTDYGDQFDVPIAYPAHELPNTFGAVVANQGLRQLRIAETEKYAHVTFFFNGGEEQPFAGEERELIPSPEVATYDLKPEMSAREVTTKLCAAIDSKQYDAIICNYANADMVGHTGNFAATVQCIEALDRCLGDVLSAAEAAGVDVLITADHGNAEKMLADDDSGEAHTAHTSNLVPLIYVGRSATIDDEGSLVDIAPTLLTLLSVDIPKQMTGRPLVKLNTSAQDAA